MADSRKIKDKREKRKDKKEFLIFNLCSLIFNRL